MTDKQNHHKAVLGATLALIITTCTLGSAAWAASPDDPRSDGLPVFGPGASYHPHIAPAEFGPNIDNPWFPLAPGTTFTYVGTKDGKAARDVVTVTSRTAVIDGVTTRIIFDRLFLDGALSERTFDYYAQDDDGNVWYFGEDTVALDAHGKLTDREGSFRAGVDGALPGVYMQAHPERDRRFRQEWYRGHAEDQFRVVGASATVTVPYGHFEGALRTEETTRLEPGVLDNKLYVRGLGQVAEVSVKGPLEELQLVEVSRDQT